MILIAPAFYFFSRWLENLDKDTLNTWKDEGELPIYHYGYEQELPLSYQFIIDGKNYNETLLKRPVPL